MTEVRTTCPYCGVGCGLLVNGEEGAVMVRGDPQHPANRGSLCAKGTALGETVTLERRLLRPQLHGQPVEWDEALDAVGGGLRSIIERHGPESVAMYVSGQLLTEDYYVANKLMKGFIGSANIDTNSRLCMSSATSAHLRAFGEDLVACSYEDLESAELIVLVGSNLAWCHPVLYQRILRAKERCPNLRLVVIDPRRTPTCESADLHVPIRPGTDVTLFNGLLSYLADHGHIDHAFLDAHTRGAAATLLVAHNTAGEVSAVAQGCGVPAGILQRFYEWFASTERSVTVFSQGINQSSCGADKANAIINAHLLTGRIGRPGMGPFSITGQPNAMGGREVGGFATMLAAHLTLEDSVHRQIVQQFWSAPRLPVRAGLKAVDLFESVYEGRVKAIWIMATNPVVSLPNADRARAALQRCELVVLSDCVRWTDTAALAHVLLPAAAWGEKDGTVTNSDRHISRQRHFLPLPGQARPDWWIICQVAQRLGFGQAFAYREVSEIFDEHARLSATANRGERAFDLGGLVGLGGEGYAQLTPVQWPVPAAGHAGRPLSGGHFYHADGRARLIPVKPRAPRNERDEEYPLILNTGRIRDQWHTMTRTGQAARLSTHLPEPYVDMHAEDALAFSVRAGSLVRVVTRWGRLVARLRCSGELARGSIFVPIHWSGPYASDARVGALVNPSVDPLSGQPEFKYTPARVEPFAVHWYGCAFTRGTLQLQSLSWWACAEGGSHRRYEIAARTVPRCWPSWARSLLKSEANGDWIDYEDASTGTYRAAELRDGRLQACLYISPRPQLPSRDWLASLFELSTIGAQDRRSLLAGQSLGGRVDAGPTVCVCFNVGRNTITAAIAQGCKDPGALGDRLKAGTRCGSCVSELRALLAESRLTGAATSPAAAEG